MPGENSGPDPTQDFFANYQPGMGGIGAKFREPQVYWGQKPGGYDPVRDSLRSGAKSRGDQTRSVDESSIAFYTDFSETERVMWAKRMYASGFINDPNDMEGAFRAWSAAVDRASQIYTFTNGQKKLTPWQAMDMMEGINGGREAPAPKTTTNKSTSVDIPTVEDANAMVEAVFQNAFGRAPNDAELSRYRSVMIRKAKANPRITTTTQTVNPDGNSTQTSTSQGGYSSTAAQYDALDKAKADPEYGAYQAVTRYFNAMIGALGAPG